MKKAVSIIMLTFLILLLQGCGGDASTDPNGDNAEGDQGDNNPTELTISASNQSTFIGDTLSFRVTANDPNGTSHSFMADGTSNSNNPLSLNTVDFNESTGEFIWDTQNGDEGTYSITFTVTNNASPVETDSISISISVQTPPGQFELGEQKYIANCQSCHGIEGIMGEEQILQCIDPEDFNRAINGSMSGYANQWSNTDKEAVLFYLHNVVPNAC